MEIVVQSLVEIYGGAFDKRRSDIFWNVWIPLVMDFFASPKS